MNQKLSTDTPYIHNNDLPVWIVPISGWGSESLEEASNRMLAYKKSAEYLNINIEFSSRLGTFRSYKRAPSVGKEISEHNEKAFIEYEKNIGIDWRERFNEQLKNKLGDIDE